MRARRVDGARLPINHKALCVLQSDFEGAYLVELPAWRVALVIVEKLFDCLYFFQPSAQAS
jgi:hypothetical protein